MNLRRRSGASTRPGQESVTVDSGGRGDGPPPKWPWTTGVVAMTALISTFVFVLLMVHFGVTPIDATMIAIVLIGAVICAVVGRPRRLGKVVAAVLHAIAD